MADVDDSTSAASHLLLSAALSGLLCAATSACAASPVASRGSPPDSGATGVATPQVDSGSSAAAGGTEDSGSTPVTSMSFACDAGVLPNPSVTSSSVVVLSLDDFSSQCETAHGVVEIQPHCGGLNLCRGMSYDTGTQMLTDHSCRATNTCAGYTCVICD